MYLSPALPFSSSLFDFYSSKQGYSLRIQLLLTSPSALQYNHCRRIHAQSSSPSQGRRLGHSCLWKEVHWVLLPQFCSSPPLIYTMILTWDTSRIILPGWLLLITQFVFTVRCLSQLREATSLIFCWVTEDTCMVDIPRQLNQISGSWRYCLIIPI